MNDYSKITALYSRLSVGDEDRDGGESNSIQNQKKFLESYARQLKLTNIRHYIDDDESGRFFDRSAYSRMIEDVENGKIGVCIMKDMTRWGRDYLQVGNAMEIFRRNNVRFIAVNNGIDSENPDTLEFAPFINIMLEWYAKDTGLSERRDERQDRHSHKDMENRVCHTDRRAENAQPEVSCIERGSERSRADTKERLQYLATGTAGTRTAQGTGYGAVTDRAAG